MVFYFSDMNSDVLIFKVPFLQVTLNCKLDKMIISNRHSISNFAHHLDHSSRCKLYIITHTKEKPSATN